MKLKELLINLPPIIKVIVWLNNNNKKIINFYIYNETKKMSLYFNIEKDIIKYDRWCNCIIIKRDEKNKYLKIENFFFNFLKSWDSYFFSKIKFKGKGFRIRFLKKLKLVKFYFGKSHKSFVLFKKVLLKKINKYKFIIKNLKNEKVINNSNLVVKIRPINFYTLRGLRKSRQIIFKRKGKKGTYI